MRITAPQQLTLTAQLTRSTVTASVYGLVGVVSPELTVLASPRSTRCLYCNKDFRCLTKSLVTVPEAFELTQVILFTYYL